MRSNVRDQLRILLTRTKGTQIVQHLKREEIHHSFIRYHHSLYRQLILNDKANIFLLFRTKALN